MLFDCILIVLFVNWCHFQISDAIVMENIGTEYRIGLKSLHDLYPSKMTEKINADSKLKTWDEKHKTAVADVSRRLSEFDAANTSSNSKLKDQPLEIC